MSQSSSEFQAKVFPDEFARIVRRRVTSSLPHPPTNEKSVSPSISHGLVGLALSGGGIRSALFNLGLLQAFSHRGLLRYVDYLSSVSGGGYIAGHLAELALRHGAPSKSFHEERLASLDCDPRDGRLANETRIGKPDGHLANVLELARNYVVPTALNIALYLSVLGAAACLIAMFWRLFDDRVFREYFQLLNGVHSGDELLIAFLPSLIVLLLWATSTIAGVLLFRRTSAFKRGLHKVFLSLALATVVIGLIVFSSNGVTAIGKQDDFSGYWSFGSIAIWIGCLAGALQILSAIGMKQLLRSGREQAPIWQKLIRRFVSAACLVVPPLAMIHFMARDNISHYATNRPADLVIDDIRNHLGFYELLEQMPPIPRPGLLEAKRAEQLLTNSGNGISGKDDYERWKNRPLLTWRGTESTLAHLWNLLTADDQAQINEYKTLRDDAESKRQEQLDKFNTHLLSSHYFTHWIINKIADDKNALQDQVPESETQSQNLPPYAALWNSLTRRLTELKPPSAAAVEQVRSLLPAISHNSPEGELLSLYFGQAYPSGAASLTSLQHWDRETVGKLNRLLLEVLHPSLIRPRTMNATSIVAAEDQLARFRWLGFWLLLGSIAGISLWFLKRANHFPLYCFYRDALNHNFLCRGNQNSLHKAHTTQLDRLATCDHGMPYHLFVGTAMRPNWSAGQFAVERQAFLFSERWCGLGDTYERTVDYVRRIKLTLSDAVAISGAALTPLMTNNLGLVLIMWLFNLRLGRDLPVPQSEDGATVHVADGGFREYFGLEELLRRRCKVIIVSDAGCNNGKNELSALADVVRTVRGEMGVEFLDLDHDCPFDIDRVRRLGGKAPSAGPHDPISQADDSRIPQQIMAMRVRYPADASGEPSEFGTLFYVQMALCGTEDVDLQQIRKVHPNFPDESTLNQFFTGEQSESYRQLGYHIGSKLCVEMPPGSSAPSAAPPISTGSLEKRLLIAYQHECFREQTVDSQDATPASIFAASVDINDSDSSQADAFDDLLRRFEEDAELRRAERRKLLSTVRPPLYGHGASDSGNFQLDPEQFILTVLSCHELANGPVATFPSRLFQIGGRRRLMHALVQILPAVERYRERLDKFKGKQPPREQRRTQWKASLLYLVSSQVFIEHGEETALLLKDLLERGHLRQSTLQSATRQAVS